MSDTISPSPVAQLTPAEEAASMLNLLREQAASLLGAALSTPLSTFQSGALGNFPYYWQNPRDLSFNNITYNWISSGLRANCTPVALDQSFTNYYIQAITCVSYFLSQNDRNTLNAAARNATEQSTALLNAWKQAYGSLPPATATQQPIDIIMSTIANQWAIPATNLVTIQNSKDLNKLLNNAPPSGKPIINNLASYLLALGSAISLQNSTTMNAGYLQAARSAAQLPSAENGAITTDAKLTVPAYQVSTPLSDIINGLKNLNNKVSVSMSVNRYSESDFSVKLSNQTSFTIPLLSFLTLSLDTSNDYFSQSIAVSGNKVTVEMEFTGVTLVKYGPSAFNASIEKNWYWTQPITEAIANGDQDISGFKFSPVPNIDFSKDGPFGFLEGVAIANYPTITITVTSADYKAIEEDFSHSTTLDMSFLGIPLSSTSSDVYSHKASSNSSTSTVTITLTPPPEIVAGTSIDSTGWVLGVQPQYPAAI